MIHNHLFDESQYRPSHQRGVIYFSRVPANMRPSEIRMHFQQFGEMFRQKFIPMKRLMKSSFGEKGSVEKHRQTLQFKEGWLEFFKREDAKRAADAMNGQPVVTKRRRKCFGELWCVKYLGDNFNWDVLLGEKEAAIRERKFKEHTAKESERSLNEQFRRMVQQNAIRKEKRSKEATARSAPRPLPTKKVAKRTKKIVSKVKTSE